VLSLQGFNLSHEELDALSSQLTNKVFTGRLVKLQLPQASPSASTAGQVSRDGKGSKAKGGDPKMKPGPSLVVVDLPDLPPDNVESFPSTTLSCSSLPM
jgi:hypothetical protein